MICVTRTKGVKGASAYEIAVTNGFVGTEAEWLQSLQGERGSDVDMTTQNALTKEPTGFPDRINSTFSFNNLTREFTIEPVGLSFDIWSQGKKISISTPQTIQLPNVTDKYFIYFDNLGGLGITTTFDDSILNDKIFTATVYWNATKGSCEFLVDERHGLTMDWATHFHLHNSFGTRYYGGFGLSFDKNGLGTADTDNQIAVSQGIIADEDIPTTILHRAIPTNFFEQVLSPVALIPVCYQIANEWYKDTATNFPVKLGVDRLFYNNNALTEATQNFVAYWIFATPEINTPIISIMGGRQDETLENAIAKNNYTTIEWGDLPSQEYKILYRLIFETNPLFTNATKSKLVDVQDLRGSIDSTFNSDITTPVSVHSTLIGLDEDDHTQYFNQTRGDSRYYSRTEISSFFNTTVIITSVTTTVLTASTNNKVILSGTTIDQIVNLGDATTYVIGKTYQLISNNAEVISILNGGGTEILRLEPYNTIEFTLLDNSTANGVWFQKLTFAPPNRGYSFRDEFNTGTTITGMTAWSSLASGSGAGATSVGTLFGRRSVYQISTGTTNTGRIAFSKSSNGVLFGNGIMFCYKTQIYIPILSDATNRYLLTFGYGDNIAAGDHLDGVYFEYDESQSPNWRLKTANNGSRTIITTGVAIAINTWTKLRIEVNRAGNEVLFFINGAFVGNITTNIPTTAGRNTDLLYKISKSAGLVARTVLVDYVSENIYINR